MSTKKIVIVTGANKSLGYETVKALLESDQPYHVFLGSRSLERGQEAVAKLQKECAGVANTVEALQVDLESDESIEKAFETVKTSFGRIDALINNAGAQFRHPPILLCVLLMTLKALPRISITFEAKFRCGKA